MNESTQIQIQNLFLIVYHIFHLAKSITLRAGHSTQLSGGSLPTSYRCIRCRPLTRLQLSDPLQNKSILCVDATVGTNFGQLSLTPRTNLHLQAVHFRFTQSWQVFCLTHPFSPGLVAVNDLVLSLQIEVGTGVNVDVGVDFFPVGVVVGMELLGVVV